MNISLWLKLFLVNGGGMMSSPKGFILYRIWYGNCLAYVGRTKQPLQRLLLEQQQRASVLLWKTK